MRHMARAQLSVRLSVLIVTVCSVFLLVGGAADAEAPKAATVEHVVVSGDTLWGIADLYREPGEDIRILVAGIKRASSLDSSLIHPGQILLVPAR